MTTGAGSFDFRITSIVDGAQEVTRLSDQLSGLFKTLVALAGIKISFDYLTEAANVAARTETLGITLEVVGRNAGYSNDQLRAYEGQLKALGITTQVARDAMTQMIQAGLPLGEVAGTTGVQVVKLARAAQDLAVVTGQNSSDTFKRLITNLQQLDTLGLRFMGLTVDMHNAQQKFASSVGKTVESLTQQQKVQAATNEAMIQAGKLSGAYEQSMESVGKKVQSLKRYQEELANAIGEKLLPAYGSAVDAITVFLGQMTKVVESTQVQSTAMVAFGESIGGIFSSVGEFTVAALESTESFGTTMAEVGLIITHTVKELFDWSAALIRAADDAGLLQAAAFTLGISLATIRDALEYLRLGFIVSFSAVLSVLGDVTTALGWLATKAGFTEFGETVSNGGKALKELGEKGFEAGTAIAEGINKGDTALGRFVTRTTTGKAAVGDFGKALNFEKLSQDLDKYSDSVSNLTPDEAVEAAKRIAENVESLGKKGKLTEVEVRNLVGRLKELGIQAEVIDEVAKKLSGVKLPKLEIGSLGLKNTASDLAEDVRKVREASVQNTASSEELAAAVAKVQPLLEKFGKSGSDAAKQMEPLQRILDTISSESRDRYSKALQDMGLDTSNLTAGINKSFSAMSGAMKNFASESVGTGKEFEAAFDVNVVRAKTIPELAALSESLSELRKRADTLRDMGEFGKAADLLASMGRSADQAKEQFTQLFTTSLAGADTLSKLEFIEQGLKSLREAGVITEETFNASMKSVGEALDEVALKAQMPEADAGMKALGLNFKEVTTGITADAERVKVGLVAMSKDSTLSGAVMYRAFEKGIGQVRTLEGISLVSEGLKSLAETGKLSGQKLQSATQLIGISFRELFEKRLNTAKTQEDFDQLREVVRGLQADLTITGLEGSTAMTKIQEKAHSVSQSLLEVARAARVAAESTAAVAGAETRVAEAGTEATRQQTVAIAARRAANNGATDELRQRATIEEKKAEAGKKSKDVAVAQLSAEVAIKEQKEAQSTLDKANRNLAENQTTANAALVVSAQKQLDIASENVEVKQKAVAAEETLRSRVQTTVAEEEGKLAILRKQNVEDQERDQNLADFTAALNAMVTTTDKAKKALMGVGYAEEDAARKGAEISDVFNHLSGGWNDLFMRIDSAYKRLQEALEEAKEAAKAADDFASAYGEAKQQAVDLEAGLQGVNLKQKELYDGSGAIADTYNRIRREAAGIAKSVEESAKAFAKSADDLSIQVLSAQGRDEEAIERRLESRKTELKLEYELLKLKIEGARIQAVAAGVSTTAITSALATLEKGYHDSLNAVGILSKIELEGVRKRREEEAKTKSDRLKQESDARDPKQSAVKVDTSDLDARAKKQRSLTDGNIDLEIKGTGRVLSLNQGRLEIEQDVSRERTKHLDTARNTAAIDVQGSRDRLAIEREVQAVALARQREALLDRSQDTGPDRPATPLIRPPAGYLVSLDEKRESISASGQSPRDGSLHSVDVIKIELGVNGQKVSVYARPEDKGDIIQKLMAAKKVTGQ